MAPVSVSATVDAPRERVFDFLGDLSMRPSFTDHFASDFRLARERASGLGAGLRFKADAPRGIEWMDTTITEVERPHLIVEQGHGGRSNRIALKAVWELTEGPGSITNVTLTFITDPAARRGGRWWRRRWSRALRRLGTAIESGQAAPEPVAVAGADRLPAA